ncbi:MAG: hypothetical protein O3A01_01210 [bacterium]|nr:hypothetical protein [bacterium]
MIERIKLILDGMLNTGNLPNGLVLASAQDADRETAAHYIGMGALCDTETPGPCGTCSHCIRAKKGAHPDYYFHPFESAIKVEDIRTIRTAIQYGPTEAKSMMVILHNAHEMTASAQNALLKSLEEPPAGVHFILTTDNAMKLLSTIRSRSFLLDIPSVAPGSQIPIDQLPVAYSPLPEFMLKSDSAKLDYAQELASDKEFVRSVLLHWLYDASRSATMDEIGSKRLELIISTLSNMQYNLNTRLQMESLVLQL